jgi:hypothetical protein
MSLLRRNSEDTIELCCGHFRIQYELQKSHVTPLYQLLEQIAESRHKEQLARLDKMHDREVVELKRQLDSQNWDEMKQLAQKKHADKQELARYSSVELIYCCPGVGMATVVLNSFTVVLVLGWLQYC